MARTSYHHGALRDELLHATVRLIEEEGVGAVSLRRVAKEAGVSPGAPYHHFSDRAALLSSIATEGFVELTKRLSAARAAAASPDAALVAVIRAYVEFATARPAHFVLMFRPELSQPEKHLDTQAAGDAALQELLDAVAASAPGHAAESFALTTVVFALGHGLASLEVDGLLTDKAEKFGAAPDTVTEHGLDLIERMLDGLR